MTASSSAYAIHNCSTSVAHKNWTLWIHSNSPVPAEVYENIQQVWKESVEHQHHYYDNGEAQEYQVVLQKCVIDPDVNLMLRKVLQVFGVQDGSSGDRKEWHDCGYLDLAGIREVVEA